MDWTTFLADLGDRQQALTARSSRSEAVHAVRCGVYGWWADEAARRVIATALDTEVPALIYVGKAGGEASVQTFATRIWGKHLRGSTRTSTLRQSLTAVLIADPDFYEHHADPRAHATRHAVSDWMREHLDVVLVPVEEVSLIEEAEQAALAFYDPPLNLRHVPSTPARARLRALRASLRIRLRVADTPGDS